MSSRAVIRARILGCGSSGGVPRVDGDWGACDPKNSKNRRSRCSVLIERAESLKDLRAGRATRLLIDTSPDLREQLLAAHVTSLDAIAYTHTHADQCHGIDDVRAIVYTRRARIKAFAATKTCDELRARFGYIFETPPGSGYPPLLELTQVKARDPFEIKGEGGVLIARQFDVEHGGAPCSGYLVGPVAYTPDVNGLESSSKDLIAGAALWIVDALREKPHPSHAHLAQTLDWINELRPGFSVLTNLHIDLDYARLSTSLPDGIRPAFDGLELVLDEESGAIVQIDPV